MRLFSSLLLRRCGSVLLCSVFLSGLLPPVQAEPLHELAEKPRADRRNELVGLLEDDLLHADRNGQAKETAER